MKMIDDNLLKRAVPRYLKNEFGVKKSDFLIAVFVLNEGQKIRNQIRQMQNNSADCDVVIADGGSTDGSLDSEFLAQHDVRALLTKLGPGKLSSQMRMAFDYALDEGYRGVIVIDGNGKDGLDAIPDFKHLLQAGYDHVQGSRFIPGGQAVNTPFSRLLGLKLIHAPIISFASRSRQTDTTNGFRGYSSRLLADEQISVFREIFSSYELHYHLAIEAGRRSDFKCIETPVSRTYPKGKIPTKITPVKGNLEILKILFLSALGRYRLKKNWEENR